MAVDNLLIGAQVAFSISSTNTGFQSVAVSDKIEFVTKPDTSVYNNIITKQYSIAASGTQDIDVFEFTNLVREEVEADSVFGIILTVTGANGECTLSPGPSNGLDFPDSGDTVIKSGGVYLYFQPTAFPVSNTSKILRLTNSGTGTMTVRIGIIVGA